MGSLEMVVRNTKEFDDIVKKTYIGAVKEVYGCENPHGTAIFAYGSPGRIELVGGDSDADLLFVESTRTKQSELMRKRFTEELEKYNFSKVDLPPWNDLHEIDVSCFVSLVEGNQVFEARALLGDDTLIREVKRRQIGYNNLERQLSNIIFNRCYLDQYFRQRARGDAPNIKYCSGGSRDFLFLSWYDLLDRDISHESLDKTYSPRVEIALRRMLSQSKISPDEYEETLNAIDYQMRIRSQLLALNRNTSDKGVTVLDGPAIDRLEKAGNNNVKEKIMASFKPVQKAVDTAYRDSIQKGAIIRYSEWPDMLWKTFELTSRSYESMKDVISQDKILRTSSLWGASENGDGELFNRLAENFKTADDWITLASLSASPYCNSKILDHIAQNYAKRYGYGYVLRVIARNKNVSKETLEYISSENELDARYRDVALAALKGGTSLANNQI